MHLALNTARRVTLGAMAQTLCPLDLSSSIHSDSDPKLTCSFESASKLTCSFEQDPNLTPSPELPTAAKTSLYMQWHALSWMSFVYHFVVACTRQGIL